MIQNLLDGVYWGRSLQTMTGRHRLQDSPESVNRKSMKRQPCPKKWIPACR